jgi:hypothetical protein
MFAPLHETNYHGHMSQAAPIDLTLAISCLADFCGQVATAEQVATVGPMMRRVQGWLDVVKSDITRASARLHAEGRSADSGEVMQRSQHVSRRDALKSRRVADTLDALPELNDLLGDGDVTADHVDSIARALDRLDEPARQALLADKDRLFDQARNSDADRFDRHVTIAARRAQDDCGLGELERQRRATRLSKFIDPLSGMYVVRIEVDELTGKRLFNKIDEETEKLRRAQRERRSAINVADGANTGQVAAHAVIAKLLDEGDSPSGCTTCETAHDGGAGDGRATFSGAVNGGDSDRTDCTDAACDHRSEGAQLVDGDRVWVASPASIGGSRALSSAGSETSPSTIAATSTVASTTASSTRTTAQAMANTTTEAVVFLDYDTLLADATQHGLATYRDGQPVTAPTLRRLMCNAGLLSVITDRRGVVLDAVRSRLATNDQRCVLAAMYQTCAWDGCQVPIERCYIHHVTFDRHGGRTELANLLPVCSKHHHRIHEGGWTLTMDAQRTIMITRPDGELHGMFEFTGHPYRPRPGPPQAGSPRPVVKGIPLTGPSASNDQEGGTLR